MTKEEKLERINEMKQLYFSSDLKLAMIHPQIYNIKQIDFIDDVNIKDGICEYVSIYSAYQNMFKNGKQDIIDIINLTDNKDMKGSEIVQTINNFLPKHLFEYHIIENDLKDKSRKNIVELQKMVDNLIHSQKCLPLGYYPALLHVNGHMVNVLGQDNDYYYYVENGYDPIVYLDCLRNNALNLLTDIVTLSDYTKSIYYQTQFKDLFEKLKDNQEMFLFDDSFLEQFYPIIQFRLTNKGYKSKFISTINKGYFYKAFSRYYYVTLRNKITKFSSMYDTLQTFSTYPKYGTLREEIRKCLLKIAKIGNLKYTEESLNKVVEAIATLK